MLKDVTLAEIVNRDICNGYVLYTFGIRFYENSACTLEEACNRIGIKTQHVAYELKLRKQLPLELPPASCPLPLLIEYLKHSHSVFIKHKLPYIGQLIEHSEACTAEPSLSNDLKIVFPLFARDFIEHIYFEEDTLFKYILQLENALDSNSNYGKLFFQLEQNSIQAFASQHDMHDDEMRGIRRFTNNYLVNEHTPLSLKVIYFELLQFEQSLQTHAQIENEILFPKALLIEQRVREKVFGKSQLN